WPPWHTPQIRRSQLSRGYTTETCSMTRRSPRERSPAFTWRAWLLPSAVPGLLGCLISMAQTLTISRSTRDWRGPPHALPDTCANNGLDREQRGKGSSGPTAVDRGELH